MVMQQPEPDVRPVIAALFAELQQGGASPFLAMTLAIEIVLQDLHHLIVLMAFDHAIRDRIELMHDIIETSRSFNQRFHWLMRVAFWLNMFVSALGITWFVLLLLRILS
jgi:hypothetical protein